MIVKLFSQYYSYNAEAMLEKAQELMKPYCTMMLQGWKK